MVTNSNIVAMHNKSHGYFGDDYAMRAALDFESGSPDLETLIDWSNN